MFLKARNRTEGYPLFETVYKISWEGMPVEDIFAGVQDSKRSAHL